MKLVTLLQLAIVFALSAATSAFADPVPAYLRLPAGYALGTTSYHRYDGLDLGIPARPEVHQASQHLLATGHYWHIQLTGNAQALNVDTWRPALEQAGWQILQASGTLIARHDAPGGPAYFKYTGGLSAELLETAPAPSLTLPAPAATPETPTAGQDIAYLPPLAGMTQTHFAIDDHFEEMTGPLTGGPFIAGPPTVRVDYRGPQEISGLEVQSVYQAAFTAAGWAINFSHAGGTTVAHYSQNGRDIWAKLYGGNGELHIVVADIGANAAAARLRAAIERDGHIALYGIYFDVDSDVLRPDSEPTLRQILALLHDVPGLRVEIQGHTDNTGTPARNQPLSESRAASVRRWLIEHGMVATRLTSAGYGERVPVADNHTMQGRALNRRVELVRRAP